MIVECVSSAVCISWNVLHVKRIVSYRSQPSAGQVRDDKETTWEAGFLQG